ncbi:SDR family NAD(P)-dependent oxidoreductase [Bauldia sp.]|uniref:SDR family NAD(P)-dependent oxidoreductase n=1 Tax=Bauldia sp. TaxID=2575872 RepID=UPI003BAB1E68
MNKVTLVTGAASGIGEAAARVLAEDGHRLVLMDIDTARLTALTEALGRPDDILAITGSVADLADCQAAVALARDRFGRLDGLSHNAGIQTYGTAEETSLELWDRTINVNLTGAFLAAKAALPALRDTGGAIVFMGSGQSLAAQQGAVAYVTAKHGMHGLCSAIAVDHAAEGVRANIVAPGAIDTPMLRKTIAMADDPAGLERILHRMNPTGRIGAADEIAAVVAFLLSDKASFLTGELIRVDGGLLSLIGGSPEV